MQYPLVAMPTAHALTRNQSNQAQDNIHPDQRVWWVYSSGSAWLMAHWLSREAHREFLQHARAVLWLQVQSQILGELSKSDSWNMHVWFFKSVIR